MDKPRRTPRQSEAIESVDRSVCVRAGAGTGKTFVLVGRYMELLRRRLAGSVREIAALTYTEKAAKEMKDRLRRECLAEERSATGPEAAWWRRQRIDLESAHVGTLHSFCMSLLYEHPVEAGVDPQFTMLDEVAQSILARRAIDDVMRRELDADSPGVLALLREMSRASVRNMLDYMISRRVDSDGAAAALDDLGDEREAMNGLARLLAKVQAEFLSEVMEWARGEDLVARLKGPVCADPHDKADERRRRTLALLGEIDRAPDAAARVAFADELRGAIATLTGGSSKKWNDDGFARVQEIFKALRGKLDEVPGEVFGREPDALDAKSLAHARTLVRLYRECAAAYTAAKADDGCLDFEDLLIRARDLLAKNESVRRRVQEKVRFLLVDELQDCAVIDREIILLVAADPDASRRAEHPVLPPGRLFVVGDDKQSIYRFRGSEVTVFHDLGKLLGEQGGSVDLDRSFRTVPAGVAFANDFFGRVLGTGEPRHAYESRYVPLDASRKEKSDFLEVILPPPVEDESADDAREREAKMLAARLRAMVDNHEKLAFDEKAAAFREVRFGDVALLFRAMTAVDVYERALRDAGVPYFILGGGGFYRAQEVLDVLTALKALERPRDPVALVGTLRSPIFGISDETLFFASRRGTVRQGLDEAESVENITDDQRRGLVAARTILRDLAAVKNRLPISRLVGELLGRTGYDAALLAQFNGRQRLANVEKLVDLARGFEAKGLFTLDEFIRYIEEFVSVEERESEAAAEEESSDVVRIMSVHRAKGLEFPVVFVPDLAHRRMGRGRALELDRSLGVALGVADDDDSGARPILYDIIRREDKLRDEAEDLRVLYVAFTRAKDRLVLSAAPAGRPVKGTWLERLASCYDLSGESFTYGKDGYRAPILSKEPAEMESAAKERHAAWKVVARLDRLVERSDIAARLKFPDAARIEPIPLDLAAKRRFVASEFAEYLYCAQRYYLSRILGLLPGDVGVRRESGASSGLVFGTVVHRALAAWDYRPGTLAKTVERAVAGVGLSGSEKGREVERNALAMIRSAFDAGLFESASAASERIGEYPVAARIEDFIVEGSLDGAFLLPGGGMEIVDYKTDRVDASGIADLSAHYELQIACYALAASKAGMNVTRASLLFLRPSLRRDWSCDASQLSSWTKRLAESVSAIRSGRFDERPDTTPCRCQHSWACGRKTVSDFDLDLV